MKFVLASPKQRGLFYGILEEQHMNKVMLLLDCKTRWNSTFLMLRRALRLRPIIEAFLDLRSTAPIRHFALNQEEWRQLEYLCDLLSPFYLMTATLSELEGPTVHQVFDVYGTLFEHIEYSAGKLQRKRIEWKVKIRTGLENAHQKLREYYRQTYKSEGYVYAIATILNPRSKLDQFMEASWIDDKEDWVALYRQVFIRVFEHYKNKNPDIAVERVHSSHLSQLDCVAHHIHKKHCTVQTTETTQGFAEVETYLGESKSS